ncbi:hypothetical protein TSAR_009885 [Trichomalopsis sarcophagae]|uniref:Uncharacterized protein n=1 Tax=Trichomalopsis sarcophagae TaxID=543379 RepID=A0A232EIT9_9HYME|nr:hypothetical protein TSAR_009885 [Trichomalopsis sarcophagae]
MSIWMCVYTVIFLELLTNMHLKENNITYFAPFSPRDRPLCSADKMKKGCRCTSLKSIPINLCQNEH